MQASMPQPRLGAASVFKGKQTSGRKDAATEIARASLQLLHSLHVTLRATRHARDAFRLTDEDSCRRLVGVAPGDSFGAGRRVALGIS